ALSAVPGRRTTSAPDASTARSYTGYATSVISIASPGSQYAATRLAIASLAPAVGTTSAGVSKVTPKRRVMKLLKASWNPGSPIITGYPCDLVSCAARATASISPGGIGWSGDPSDRSSTLRPSASTARVLVVSVVNT